jgi:hypothetical protein
VERSEEERLDPDHVEDLARSSKDGVEFYPVLRVRWQNRVLDGRHRKASRKTWHEVVLPIDNALDFWKARAKLLLQRTIGEPEKVDVFSHLGDLLEEAGLSRPEVMRQLYQGAHAVVALGGHAQRDFTSPGLGTKLSDYINNVSTLGT